MDVVKTIKPGKAGSRKFQRRYGDDLIAVRYRDDNDTQKRYTTIELVVDTRDIPIVEGNTPN